jgi:hypothetical protein
MSTKDDRLTRTIKEVIPLLTDGKSPEYRLAIARGVRVMLQLTKHHHDNKTDINKQFASACLAAGQVLSKNERE